MEEGEREPEPSPPFGRAAFGNFRRLPQHFFVFGGVRKKHHSGIYFLRRPTAARLCRHAEGRIFSLFTFR